MHCISLTRIALSFCEEDYVVTRYLAEFINSLSNLAYGTCKNAPPPPPPPANQSPGPQEWASWY